MGTPCELNRILSPGITSCFLAVHPCIQFDCPSSRLDLGKVVPPPDKSGKKHWQRALLPLFIISPFLHLPGLFDDNNQLPRNLIPFSGRSDLSALNHPQISISVRSPGNRLFTTQRAWSFSPNIPSAA